MSICSRRSRSFACRPCHAARSRPCATLATSARSEGPAAEASKIAKRLPVNKLFIDGCWVEPASGRQPLPVVDPSTEEVITHAAAGDASDVDKAVRAARRAFDHGPWPKMSAKERGRVLYRLADLVEQHADELAALESLDSGKPLAASRSIDIPCTADHFRYYAGWTDKISGKTLPVDDRQGSMWAYTLHEPIGVVGQIIPWNFPLLMAAMKVAPALACGNTVVLKPAEQTPLTAMCLAHLALDAGLPPGALNVVTGLGPDVGAPLVAHKGVDKISFTGSTEVGRLVGRAAAENIKPCTLELGGKSPLIVDKHVNLDKAVAMAHDALFFNAGQCCGAGSRTYVHASVYDEFVNKSVEAAVKRRVGDPFCDGVEQGPLVDGEQVDRVMRYIEKGKQEGATLRAGGGRMGDRGFFVQPTVFADVEDGMAICRNEIFGPVQCIAKYDTLEEVLHRANDSSYGLACGILSDNLDTVNYLTRGLRTGTVWVNCYNVYDHAVPFGGYKDSGIGRDKGEYALSHYTTVKSVYQPLHQPAWR